MDARAIAKLIAPPSDAEIIHTVATFLYYNWSVKHQYLTDDVRFPTCDGYGVCPDCGPDPDPERTAREKQQRQTEDALATYVTMAQDQELRPPFVGPEVIETTKSVFAQLARRRQQSTVGFARLIAEVHWKRCCAEITKLDNLPDRAQLVNIFSRAVRTKRW